ncbi:hypothetical protein I4U23_001175 [Adineta vaga]|nr:hypothetical protein I4U23_001175 [Adineta vaga]
MFLADINFTVTPEILSVIVDTTNIYHCIRQSMRRPACDTFFPLVICILPIKGIPAIDIFIVVDDKNVSIPSLSSSSSSSSLRFFQSNIDSWYNWHLAPGTFILPWANEMWRGKLIFLEFLFHTIAIHDKTMKIVLPYELDTIVVRQNIKFQQIKARPNNWWNPLKKSRRYRLRDEFLQLAVDQSSELSCIQITRTYL